MGVFYPDRTGAPSRGVLLQLDQKTYPKISHLIPQCWPTDPEIVSGFQVNAALNWRIISNHCKVTGWPSVERCWDVVGQSCKWKKLANFQWAGIVWSDSIMSAKTESPSSSALPRTKSVLSNSGWTQMQERVVKHVNTSVTHYVYTSELHKVEGCLIQSLNSPPQKPCFRL